MDQLFRMFKVDKREASKISASPDAPHQHDFEELIIGMEGQLEHFIDFKNTRIAAPLVSFVTKVNPADPKAAETEYAQRNPTKRLGQPHEVAKLVAFLLSDDNGYVNGQTIAIDGGESNIYGNS